MTVGRAVGEIRGILRRYAIPNYVDENIDEEHGIYDLLDIIIEDVYGQPSDKNH